MIAYASEFHQTQVALNKSDLGSGRDAFQTKTGGKCAFMHHAVAAQIGLKGILDNQRIRIGSIFHDTTHQPGIHQRMLTIGEGKGSCIAQQGYLCHGFAATFSG